MPRSHSSNLTWRHVVLGGVVVCAFAVILVHLYRVQVLDHDTYMKEAAVTRQGALTVSASRGAILDATGYPLATSINTWDVSIDRFQWRDQQKAQQTNQINMQKLQLQQEKLNQPQQPGGQYAA